MTSCHEREQGPTNSKHPASGECKNQLERHRNGAEFKRIYQSHSRNIYSFCLCMVGNREEAETLMQEAFLKLFRQADANYSSETSATLLYRSVITALRMRTGTLLRSQACDLAAATGATQSVSPGAIAPCRLKRAIVELPLDLRVVFVLYDVLGYEHDEISEVLEFSPETTKAQTHKARLRMREELCIAARKPRRADTLLRPQQNQASCGSEERPAGQDNEGQNAGREGFVGRPTLYRL